MMAGYYLPTSIPFKNYNPVGANFNFFDFENIFIDMQCYAPHWTKEKICFLTSTSIKFKTSNSIFLCFSLWCEFSWIQFVHVGQ